MFSDIYQSVPSDYVLTQLEALGQILSYCLLEGGQGGLSSGPQPNLSASHQNSIVANLVHVFGGPVNPSRQPASKEQLLSARRSLLSMTPRLVLALIALWNSVSKTSDQKNTNWLVGSSKAVKNMILDLLSPIATIHPTYLLSAVAVAWAEKGISLDLNRKVLVELITSLRMFPTSTVLSTMRLVLKSPPPVSGKGTLSLEVSSLQFLSSYLSSTSPTTLAESWNSLKDLLKDCLSLAPPSVFLALEILHQVVVSGVAANLEKRDSRELQVAMCLQLFCFWVVFCLYCLSGSKIFMFSNLFILNICCSDTMSSINPGRRYEKKTMQKRTSCNDRFWADFQYFF